MPIRKDKAGRWHVDLCVRGQRLHRKLPAGTTEADAKRLDAEYRVALERNVQAVIPGDPPILHLLAHYAEAYAPHALRSPDTAKHHAVRIGTLATGYTASQARQFAANAIEAMRPHYAPATINRSLGTVKKALTLAFDKGLTRENYGAHIKRLPENNARTVYLSVAQVQAIARHCTVPVQTAIWVALLTGARRGEVCKIRAEDIGRDTILIRAGNTKTEKTKTVPIVPALRPWLKHLPLAITFEGVKSGFRRARVKAGLEHVHYHDLRHSCASILLELGADLYTVSKILGHTSIKTTERYAHLQVKAQRSALGKLGRLVKAKPTRKRITPGFTPAKAKAAPKAA